MPTIPLIRRKTIGKHVIWERKPKPRGLSKYVVGLDGDGQNMVKDFSRYALAVLWIKAQSPRPVPHVVILLDGGLVQGVLSTIPCDYTVLDGDDVNDDDRAITIPTRLYNGETVVSSETDTTNCYVHGDSARVDPDRIATILNAVQPIPL